MSYNVSRACSEYSTLKTPKRYPSVSGVKLYFVIMTEFDRSIRNTMGKV